MASVLRLLKCDECGFCGYGHRRLGLLVDGQLHVEVTLCRRCAVARIDAASNVIEDGDETPFKR